MHNDVDYIILPLIWDTETWTQSNDNELWLRTCHISSYIIYFEKATADLKSKYRKVCVVHLHTK